MYNINCYEAIMMENDEKQIFDELIVEKYKQKLKQISSDEQDDYLLFNPEKSSTKIDDNLQVFKDYLALATEQFEKSLQTNNDRFLKPSSDYSESNEIILDLNNNNLNSNNINSNNKINNNLNLKMKKTYSDKAVTVLLSFFSEKKRFNIIKTSKFYQIKLGYLK